MRLGDEMTHGDKLALSRPCRHSALPTSNPTSHDCLPSLPTFEVLTNGVRWSRRHTSVRT